MLLHVLNFVRRSVCLKSDALQMMQVEITGIQPPNHSKGEDFYHWRMSDGTFGTRFSSKVTWNYLRISSQLCSGTKWFWFKERMPRNAFVTCLALLRLLTKDRLRRWGLNVPDVCVLCLNSLETHHYLFFEREYSSTIWLSLM